MEAHLILNKTKQPSDLICDGSCIHYRSTHCALFSDDMGLFPATAPLHSSLLSITFLSFV